VCGKAILPLLRGEAILPLLCGEAILPLPDAEAACQREVFEIRISA